MPIASAIAPNQSERDQVVQHVVAVVRPERHLPLRVVQRMQRPPPAEHVRQPVAPVVGEIEDDRVDAERQHRLAEQEREQPLQHRRHPALVGEPAVQRHLRLVEQHEGDQRQHADARQHGVEHVHADRLAVRPALHRAPALQRQAEREGQRHLHRAIDGEQRPAVDDVLPLASSRTGTAAGSAGAPAASRRPGRTDPAWLSAPAPAQPWWRRAPRGSRKMPCGERPTSIVSIVAGRGIEHRDLLGEAAGDPDAAVRREGDVVRAAGHRCSVRIGVSVAASSDSRGAAGAVVHPQSLAVRATGTACARPCR